MDEKNKKSCFFEETFLLANISMDITYGLLFFILNNIEVNFTDWKLKQRSYITTKILLIIR